MGDVLSPDIPFCSFPCIESPLGSRCGFLHRLNAKCFWNPQYFCSLVGQQGCGWKIRFGNKPFNEKSPPPSLFLFSSLLNKGEIRFPFRGKNTPISWIPDRAPCTLGFPGQCSLTAMPNTQQIPLTALGARAPHAGPQMQTRCRHRPAQPSKASGGGSAAPASPSPPRRGTAAQARPGPASLGGGRRGGGGRSAAGFPAAAGGQEIALSGKARFL